MLESGLPSSNVAIITPYAAQARLLRDRLQRTNLELEIDTVDGFQGREKEAVIISLVRSNSTCEIGFLADTRRMNVALTRARRKLIVVGDSATIGAHDFYQRLLDEFPKSDYLDFAYNGLAEIAFDKGDLKNALRYYGDGTEKIAASQKLKELTVGRGKTLMALNRLDEARKVFEQVASVREWRGESTAFSVYSLGEIEAKRGHWAEANAYFQRVYIGYQKFLPWVAKAYLRSAESFEKLGKAQEAANTYRELLRNEKLASFGEAAEARKRLQALGEQG